MNHKLIFCIFLIAGLHGLTACQKNSNKNSRNATEQGGHSGALDPSSGGNPSQSGHTPFNPFELTSGRYVFASGGMKPLGGDAANDSFDLTVQDGKNQSTLKTNDGTQCSLKAYDMVPEGLILECPGGFFQWQFAPLVSDGGPSLPNSPPLRDPCKKSANPAPSQGYFIDNVIFIPKNDTIEFSYTACTANGSTAQGTLIRFQKSQ